MKNLCQNHHRLFILENRIPKYRVVWVIEGECMKLFQIWKRCQIDAKLNVSINRKTFVQWVTIKGDIVVIKMRNVQNLIFVLMIIQGLPQCLSIWYVLMSLLVRQKIYIRAIQEELWRDKLINIIIKWYSMMFVAI